MRFQNTLFLLLTLLPFTLLTAQHTVKGCVTDETEEALIGASVLVRGGTLGTVTDLDGCFELVVPDSSSVLVIDYTGYATHEVTVGHKKELVIRLAPAADLLEEVVVTGYGVAHRKDARSASMTVSDAPAYEMTDRSMSETRTKKMVAGDDGSVSAPGPAAGQLTAGETNDFSKWEMWEDISQEDLAEFREVWGIYPRHRYAVQLTYPGGMPAVDIKVSLNDATGKYYYTARTDNHGRAELWYGLHDAQANPADQLRLVAHADGKVYQLNTTKAIAAGINAFELPLACHAPAAVDIAFVVDATGSMGDEMRYLTSELTDVVGRAKSSLANADLRTAAVFYRDSSDAYVTRHQNFLADTEKTVGYFACQRASGGGDHPEAVDAALATAVDSLDWREEATARLLFLVLDAPPHQSEANLALLRKTTTAAAAKGVRVIPVVCSGMTKDGEYLLRSLALATNGTYVFLTDDSGIGGEHLAPTTDAYEVEKLNDLMVRLIIAFGAARDCGQLAGVPAIDPIAPVREKLRVKAYPNPTAGPVQLKLPKTSGTLRVFDLSGKLLRQRSVDRKRMSIDLSGLAAATYLVSFEHEGESGSQRVVLTANAR